MIYAVFYTGQGQLYDRLIRWWTCSDVSHVELGRMSGDGMEMVSSSPRDGGVRVTTIDHTSGHWRWVPLTSFDAAAWDNATCRIGEKYDWLGIVFSQIIGSGRQGKNKSFCSEFVAEMIGLPEPFRYTPGQIEKLLKWKQGD